MPLARLENFLKNLSGNTLYVDPNDLDSTDSIENKGNSQTRPFKTIQRALLEATRFSYVVGSNNDLFDQTTIMIAPGTHYIDNRPGYYWDGSNFRNANNSVVTINELTVASDFDLGSVTNQLYIYNSAEGGVIVPKGVSLVASDLRKTKIRPKFVPDPANDNIARSAIFRVTGGSYIFGFTIFDGNPTGGVYNTYTTTTVNPTYSHHKLTAFEYADGKNIIQNSTLTDLDNYYYKVSKAFGAFSGRAIPDTFTDLQKNPEENKIVGDLGQGSLAIQSLISGDGTVATTTITVTTEEEHGLTPFTPIQVSGVASINSTEVQQKLNGNFVVAQIINAKSFTYLVQEPAPAVASPSVTGSTVKVQSDTVSSSSPYIFNCSLKSVYGMNGLHADGSKATGFKSIVTAQFTGISLQRDDRAFVKYSETSGSYLAQTGYGVTTFLHQDSESLYHPSWESFHIKASNDAFIQCVSIFAIGYAKQFVAESGGDQSITNSNSNFGAISLVSTGFRGYQLPKDNHAFITHIIPPKEIDSTESDINCYSINVGLTTASGNTTKIYLNSYVDPFTPPNSKIRGYTIGGRESDKIYYTTYSGSATISPNYETSYNIDSISNSVIAVEGTLTGITAGQAVRVIANNAILPDGIDPHKVYYVSSNSLSSTTLKLRESLSSSVDIDIKNAIGIDFEDNLKIVFRVSDCSPGNVGSPFQFDSTNNCWYLGIQSNAAFVNSLVGKENPTFTIKRKLDTRTSDDTVYRARVVIPKEARNASELSPGFIIQKSSSSADSFFIRPDKTLDSDGNDSILSVRNTGLIVDAWSSVVGINTVVNIITNTPHNLKVGNKVNIYDLKSSNEPNPVGLGTGTGFNGSFVVSEVVDNLHFKFIATRNPGTITGTAASSTASWLDVRNCASSTYRVPPYTVDYATRTSGTMPYFTCEQTNSDYQIYKIKKIQDYSYQKNDGIYHIYLNSFKNTPSVVPFNIDKYKLSQNLDNIYPKFDIDNAKSDVNSTISAASRKTIGKVEVNDEKFSTTKETFIQYLSDFGGGLKVSSISKVTNTCTVTTALDHNISGIRQLNITSPGSGFVDGTYYDIPTCTSTGSGRGATVTVTVSGGQVTSTSISHSGSAYNIGDTITIKGIPGSTTTVACTVLSVVPENIGAVQILGSLYPENNGTFKVNSITPNTISYINSSGIVEDSSIATIIPNIPTYTISSIGLYNSSTNTTEITTSVDHPFFVGNKVIFENSLTEFTVSSVSSSTTFKVSGNVAGNPTTVYTSGLNSQSKDTNSTNENIGSRLIPVFDGFKGRSSTSLTTTSTQFTARLANATSNSGLGIRKGDFLQMDEEIVLVNAVVGTTVSIKRGVLGTKASSHASNVAFRRVIAYPIELRRNSILRASGHTFEYTGFGPGNYSTGMPSNQDRVLTNDEVLISQSLPSNGGLVVYTGMNSNGEFFIGRKKYDATTGEEISIAELPESDTTFFDNFTVNDLTVNSMLDATTANSKFGDVSAGIITATYGDFENLNVGIITATNANVGIITASSFVGPLTGNVTGNLTGNVTGNVTGNLTGNVTGNVTGNLTGDVTGNATSASAIKTQSNNDNANLYLTFVDSNNGSAINENLKTASGLQVNPSLGALLVDGIMRVGGYDLELGRTNQVDRGDSGNSRALVKDNNSTLVLNFENDFTGGIRIDSDVKLKSGKTLYAPGSVVQVESRVVYTSTFTNYTDWVDTDLYVDIIPKSANSKILILANAFITLKRNPLSTTLKDNVRIKLFKNAIDGPFPGDQSVISGANGADARFSGVDRQAPSDGGADSYLGGSTVSISILNTAGSGNLDGSPHKLRYKVKMKAPNQGTTVFFGNGELESPLTSASITAIEIYYP